ncbi:MAG: cellulose synthase [Comamonadaceae bacterium]|nr:MAG: cellulose synthase [Comamonadaceae bacterium]
MNNTFPLPFRRAALLLVSCLPLLTSAQPAAPAAANSPADVFRRLAADRWVPREVTLSELGFAGPLVLGAPDTVRELYLPVPANVPLTGGEIKLNGSYMRGNPGRTTLVISLDSYPVSSRPFAQDKGDAGIVLGVDGSPRPGGFVRLGLNWTTALDGERICGDGRAQANVLRIDPDSRFTYRYDATAVRDLATAWGALPSQPVVMVSSRNIGSPAYDSAWRMGAALERAGKRSTIATLPAIGDTVSLEGVAIAPALRGLPAFAALSQGGKVQLKDAAQIGALLALGTAGPVRADIVIADKAMSAGLKAAFDALAAQLQSATPDAVTAFAEWRAAALDPWAATAAAGTGDVRLAPLFGRPAIVVAENAGQHAAGLFSSYWSRVAVSPAMGVRAAALPKGDASSISLTYLGGKPGSFDVLAHADWNASFDIGAVAANGRLPASLVLDIAAAPSAARTPLVASVFMNDILLGARQMDANGKAERITAPIPRYALSARNTLRVSFVRQMASDRCRETPEPYPVSVLPSSHMLLEKASASDDFTGMVSRFSDGAHVMVPAAYLADAANTLPRVIRMAATTGVSPLNAKFTAVNGDAMPSPGGPFLAMELPWKDVKSKVTLDKGRMVLAADGDDAILDVAGLDNVGIVEVVKISGDTGVIYRGATTGSPAMDKPLLLAQGDVALIGSNGLLREINTADPAGRQAAAADDGLWSSRRGYWWTVPILIVVFMVALLVYASRTRRRRASKS